MTDIATTDAATETTEETTKTQTVANIAVLSFALIGAYSTTRFAVTKVAGGLRAVKAARARLDAEAAQTIPAE